MKVAIFMSTYNKNGALPNTLYSISRQEVSFPFEVCIVDDGSDVDPEPIVKKFFPDVKYERLGRVGLPESAGKCFDLVSDDVDTIVFQSADVMYLQDDLLEGLCQRVESKRFAMAHVKNIEVDPYLYKYFDDINNGRKALLDKWETVGGIDVYSGTGRPSGDWLLFLGAMTREDLESIGFRNNWCDVVLQERMKRNGLIPAFLDHLKAAHQKHPPVHGHPCSIMDQCEYWCIRKGGLLR